MDNKNTNNSLAVDKLQFPLGSIQLGNHNRSLPPPSSTAFSELQRAHSFNHGEPAPRPAEHAKRWSSCPSDYMVESKNKRTSTGTVEDERLLQKRRQQAETNVQNLYEGRKDHIMELFQESWIISVPLEEDDEDAGCVMNNEGSLAA